MTAMFDLTDRHVLVTGGLGLLGAAIVDALQCHGASVTVLDRLPALDGVRAVQCDLSSVEDIRAAVSNVEEMWGPVDTLINNAASRGTRGRYFDSVEDYEPETWAEVVDVNLDAVFWMSQAVGSRMAERGSGCIINTASIYASDMGVARGLLGIEGGGGRDNEISGRVLGLRRRARQRRRSWRHRGRAARVLPAGLREPRPDGPHGQARGRRGRLRVPCLGCGGLHHRPVSLRGRRPELLVTNAALVEPKSARIRK